LGILLPLTSLKTKHLTQVIFVSVAISLIIEVIQYLTKLGVFDIDKLILNILGSTLGFYVYKVVYNLTKKTNS
uniref:VanZ family protein n=1 Tax=Gracilibacillus sp. YIM 98692 TaxID=2663532 RepID=UPI0013D19002